MDFAVKLEHMHNNMTAWI